METIVTPCRVPWMVSPSGSGVTLSHGEGDTEPQCTVVLGAGRLREDDRTDGRRVEIAFDMCYHARVGVHGDGEGVEALGYKVDDPVLAGVDYLDWLVRRWRETGFCPRSGFWVATRSAWLDGLPGYFRRDSRHYIVDGRDGYVELIARRFRWREWLWTEGHRELAPERGPVIGHGEGTT